VIRLRPGHDSCLKTSISAAVPSQLPTSCFIIDTSLIRLIELTSFPSLLCVYVCVYMCVVLKVSEESSDLLMPPQIGLLMGGSLGSWLLHRTENNDPLGGGQRRGEERRGARSRVISFRADDRSPGYSASLPLLRAGIIE